MHPSGHDEIEQVMFIARYWQYFMAGLASLAGIVFIIRKGKGETIIALSEKHIDNKLHICALELEEKMDAKFHGANRELKKDLLREIKLMIEASKND